MNHVKAPQKNYYTAFIGVLLAAAPLAGISHAANFTWDGELSNSWGESRTVGNIFFPRVVSNWEPDGYLTLQLPTSSDRVIFGEFTTGNRTINLNGNRTVDSVEFKNAQNFNLTNGTLFLASGGLTSTSTSTQTLDADVTLQSSGSWDISEAPVVVNGRIYSSNSLTKRGGGNRSI